MERMDGRVYAFFYEHFELINLRGKLLVTCICGQDFLWPEAGNKEHPCPYCGEVWQLENNPLGVMLTRVSSGSNVELLYGDDGTMADSNAGLHAEHQEAFEASAWTVGKNGVTGQVTCLCGKRFSIQKDRCPYCGSKWKVDIRKNGLVVTNLQTRDYVVMDIKKVRRAV